MMWHLGVQDMMTFLLVKVFADLSSAIAWCFILRAKNCKNWVLYIDKTFSSPYIYIYI